MAQIVKRAYQYRFYPTPEQAEELARTFGCVRLVYNKALEERTRATRWKAVASPMRSRPRA
jgi:putative transposase